MDIWRKIKQEYIRGGISQRDICKKYGVSTSQLYKRSVKEHWVDEREKYRVNVESKALQKSIEKVSDADAQFNSYAAEIKANIMKMMSRWFAEHSEDMYDTQDYRRMMQCYKDMMELESNADETTVKEVTVILNDMDKFAK